MKKYNLIIFDPHIKISGSSKGILSEVNKKTILDYSIDQFENNELIHKILLFGDDVLEETYSFRHVSRRFSFDKIKFDKLKLYGRKKQPFILAYGNSVFLKQEEINHATEKYESIDSDMLFFYHKKDSKNKNDTIFSIEKSKYIFGNVIFFKDYGVLKKFLSSKNFFVQFLLKKKKPFAIDGFRFEKISDFEKFLHGTFKKKIILVETEKFGLLNRLENKKDLEIFKKNYLPKVYSKKKIFVIINSKAGVGPRFLFHFYGLLGLKRKKNISLEDLTKQINKYFSFYNQEVEIEYTKTQFHGTDLAKKAVKEKKDIVVVVGGDGSINEVVNGLVGSDVALGIIPFGTANVLSIQMKISSTIRKAIQIISEGKVKKIDIGKVDKHYFSCMAGVGVDANIIKNIKSSWKKLLGAFSYFISIFFQIINFDFSKKIKIKFFDGQKSFTEECYSFLAGNGCYYAGNLKLFKTAKITDGKLHFFLLKKSSILAILSFFFLSKIKKRKFAPKNFKLVICKKAKVITSNKLPVQVDGDYIKDGVQNISISSKKLSIVY